MKSFDSKFWILVMGMVCCSSSLFAQFGFVPNPALGTGYGNAWGNSYYASSAIQLPGWAGTPTMGYPAVSNWQGWQLGAVIQNTPSGVLIQQVAPGSIAERTGLRPGDVIVSVGGSQVGYSNGRIVDLIYEISRRADVNGQVRINVLDSQTRLLRTYTLNISGRSTNSGVVSGRVFVDGSGWAYGNNTIKVELLNVSRPLLTTTGGTAYVQAFGPGPFSFSLYANPTYMNANDRFRLIATLYDLNRQVVGVGMLDLAAPQFGSLPNYDIRVQPLPYGGSIYNASYASYGTYYAGQGAIADAFRHYLNREPTASESQAWQQQLASGATSLAEMKAEIIASPSFYDRVGNNPDQFIRLMLESTLRSIAPLESIQYWRSRLDQMGGDRMNLAREYIQTAG